MASYFDGTNIDENIPGIILVSHGAFAIGAVETLKMVTGDTTNIAAFSLEEGESPEQYMKEVSVAIESFPEGSIIFVDIMGGTPSNTIIMYAKNNNKLLYCIAGFNAPLLLEAVNYRCFCSGKELVNKLMEIENNGIFNVTEFIERHISN